MQHLVGRARRALGGDALVHEVRAQATEDRLHAQRYNEEIVAALGRVEETIGLLGTQVARLRAELDERAPLQGAGRDGHTEGP